MAAGRLSDPRGGERAHQKPQFFISYYNLIHHDFCTSINYTDQFGYSTGRLHTGVYTRMQDLRGCPLQPVSNLQSLVFLSSVHLNSEDSAQVSLPLLLTLSLHRLLHSCGFYHSVNTEDYLLSLDVAPLAPISICTFLRDLFMCMPNTKCHSPLLPSNLLLQDDTTILPAAQTRDLGLMPDSSPNRLHTVVATLVGPAPPPYTSC